MEEIKLGDVVKCIHTGFVGTAVAKTEFINGCIQWSLLPKLDKKSKSLVEGIMPDSVEIDSQSLEVVSTKKNKVENSNNGGPIRRGLKIKGF